MSGRSKKINWGAISAIAAVIAVPISILAWRDPQPSKLPQREAPPSTAPASSASSSETDVPAERAKAFQAAQTNVATFGKQILDYEHSLKADQLLLAQQEAEQQQRGTPPSAVVKAEMDEMKTRDAYMTDQLIILKHSYRIANDELRAMQNSSDSPANPP